MKKFLVCICLVALAVVLPSAKGSHALEFKETTYDFGNIADTHAPVVHEYEFVNVADEPVAVLSRLHPPRISGQAHRPGQVGEN